MRNKFLLWTCMLLLTATFSYAGPNDKTAKLWYPYAEWSFNNPSWNGNPFDVDARADFSDSRKPHLFYDGGTTWKLRYMCTRTGTFTFSTSSSDSDLDRITGSVTCQDNPGALGLLTAGGNNNKKFYVQGWEKAIVPAWVMIPPIYETDDATIDRWIANNIDGAGFLGAHAAGPSNRWYDWHCDGTRSNCNSENPDPATFREYEALMGKLYRHMAVVHMWMFADCQRDKCDKYHDDSKRQERLRHYLADRWGAIPNWMIGEGFDNFEDDSTAYANKWFNDLHDRIAWPHLLGMRSYSDSYQKICTDCNYYSWEYRKMDYDKWKASYDQVSDRPSFEEDRFRVRTKYDKDIPPDGLASQLRNHLWPQVMVGGVGAIYGYLINSGGSYSDVDGYPPDWQRAIKTWHDFWYHDVHRFMPDMERCNELTNGFGICVRGKHYVFYKENTNSIDFDVSHLTKQVPAVAIDTWTGQRIDLGTKGPDYNRFNAPHLSDWAVAIGDFGGQTAASEADANGDGIVNIFDLVIVAVNFGKPDYDARADINKDSTVNIFDLVSVAQNFGKKSS